MKVCHVPFTFHPNPCGGTEVYVEALARGLFEFGITSFIVAPGRARENYEWDGLRVHRLSSSPPSLARAYGQPDPSVAHQFEEIIEAERPEIVHLHARTSAVSHLLLEVAKRAGARTVFTYHTPTVTCPNGTMLRDTNCLCDGEMNAFRCSSCTLQKNALPRVLADIAASTPRWVANVIEGTEIRGSLATVTRTRALITESISRFRNFVDACELVIGVCDWVMDLLRRNHVSEHKLVLSRQGVPYAYQANTLNPSLPRKGPLKAIFLGRLEPIKGVDILLRAFQKIPDADVQLDIYGVEGTSSKYNALVTALAQGDRRIHLEKTVPARAVQAKIAKSDLTVVPSQWLETGPLVVLEIFRGQASRAWLSSRWYCRTSNP